MNILLRYWLYFVLSVQCLCIVIVFVIFFKVQGQFTSDEKQLANDEKVINAQGQALQQVIDYLNKATQKQ
jgi:prephenate dehydratase